uniref:nitrate reductase cytochrome c-type subunit n=1 Tax=Candidatus Electronema sp. TaxID=2698783 RepID=UPI004055E381
MKKTILTLSLLTVAFTCSLAFGGKDDTSPAPAQDNVQAQTAVQAGAVEPVKGLRKNEITGPEDVPVDPNWTTKDAKVPRTFIHQPPVIPHDISSFTLNTAQNDCLGCHGVEGSGAPKPFKTHYTDRDGKPTETVSKRWHFCLQCHVGQVDAPPLVENVFGSGKGKYSLGTKKE